MKRREGGKGIGDEKEETVTEKRRDKRRGREKGK